MKLGILGTGMIVKDVLTMYHELGVEKTYLFSTKKSKSQALELMKKYHLDKVYTDYDELLQSDVDTIYCALPNHLHYSFSKKALENGKNVIIEKPITANSKELEDLIEIASKNHLMIFEAMNLHYTPAFLSLKEDLNKLGDIKIVSFNYSQYSSRYNAFKDTGSDLSFTLALLDEKNDGIVLNGIYARDSSNIYAKPIEKGESKYILSNEEKEAINRAINNIK